MIRMAPKLLYYKILMHTESYGEFDQTDTWERLVCVRLIA